MCRGEPRSSVPASLRARGRLNAVFAFSAAGKTRVESLEEMGGYRMRFPRTHGRSPGLAPPAAGPACEGAIINTGGGMAGGDCLAIAIEAGADTNVLLSTPSAERIYGSAGPETEIAVSLRLGENARLSWLPRETILFSGARLARRLDVHMPASATLILAEATIFGRLASGEELVSGLFADRWRIRRGDRLLHAEQSRLEGAIGASLDRAAIGKGARAAATVIMVSPEAEDRLEAVRAAIGENCGNCGASAWDGMLIGRFLAPDSTALRADLLRFLDAVMRGGLPHPWMDGNGFADTVAVERAPHSVRNLQELMLKES